MRERRAPVIATLTLLTSAATAHAAEGAWVLWKHSYEVWVDTNKDNHRRDVAWKKVKATTAKSDCDDRRVREARAEYYTLTGQGVRATLAGSQVGLDQKDTKYKRGYRSFECFPDTVDTRGDRQVSLPGPRIPVVVLVFAGCATADTFWAKPELTPATKADMSRHGQDAYDCGRESQQTLGPGDLPSSVADNAQRWYVLCHEGAGI